METFAPFVFAQASLLLCNDCHVVGHRKEREERSRGSHGQATALDLICSMAVLSTVEQQALVAGLPLIHPPANTGNDARSSSSSSSNSEASTCTWLQPLRSLLDDTHHGPAILYRILVSDTVQRYVKTGHETTVETPLENPCSNENSTILTLTETFICRSNYE